MPRSDRWERLLGLLAERGRLSVEEAAAAVGASGATIRRDFNEFARQQLANRTHGGVVSSQAVAYELPRRYQRRPDLAQLERVAARAAALVSPGDTVGLNGGRTTTATARALCARSELTQGSEKPSLTVVTNALNIAVDLAIRPSVRCLCLGGVTRPVSYEQTGPLATQTMRMLWLDVVFLGVGGISVTQGVSCDHDDEAEINALMAERAARVCVVATGDKVGTVRLARIMDATDVQALITDATAPPTHVKALMAAGIEVLVAD